MARPICIPCQREYTCHKNEVEVLVGDVELYSADEFRCPGCDHRIIIGRASTAHASAFGTENWVGIRLACEPFIRARI